MQDDYVVRSSTHSARCSRNGFVSWGIETNGNHLSSWLLVLLAQRSRRFIRVNHLKCFGHKKCARLKSSRTHARARAYNTKTNCRDDLCAAVFGNVLSCVMHATAIRDCALIERSLNETLLATNWNDTMMTTTTITSSNSSNNFMSNAHKAVKEII